MLKSFYKNNFNLLMLFAYILICLSISAKSFDILFISKPELNLIFIINFFRSIISTILFFLFIGFILWNLVRKKIQVDTILKLFFLFIVIQIIGGINNPKIYENFYEYDAIFNTYSNKIWISLFIYFDQNYYLICLTSILLFFLIINSFFKKFKIEYLLFISLIIFSSYNTILIFNIYKSFFVSNDFSTYGNIVTAPSNSFFNHSVPRITGVSRLLFFLYIILTCFTFFFFKKINYIKITLLYLFIIFLGSLIWSFQSRTVLFTKVIIDILLLFFTQKKIINKIIIFLILTFLPIILHNTIVVIKNEETRILFMKESDLIYRKIFTKNYNDIILDNNLIIKKNRVFREKTSGRFEIWNGIIKKSKESLFFGYGSQADRWHFNRSDTFYNNASSGLFYALICGGVLGLLIYILIFYTTLKLIFFIFLKNKSFFKNNNLLTISSFFIVITLLLRSLVENSFMIFSVDNIFFLTCYYILSKKIKQSL
jgi:hypothetical protein